MSLKFSGTRLSLAFAQKQALALGRPGVGGLVESENECICTVVAWLEILDDSRKKPDNTGLLNSRTHFLIR